MARLHIYVDEMDGKTVSKFGKTENLGKIVFHNQHSSKSLTVTIQGEPGAGNALCQGSTEFPAFTIASNASEKKMAFKVCDSYTGDSFEYTATLDGAVLEDPIIIIERSGWFGGEIAAALGIGVVGIAIGALTTRWMKSRAPART